MKINFEKRRRRTAITAAIALAAGLTACASGSSSAERSSSSSSSSSSSIFKPTGVFEFDDRGGGSTIIMTYSGFGDSEQDKTPNGTYRSGNQVTVDCQATGRDVPAHPEMGETPGHSNRWYGVEGSDPTRYATATYGKLVLQTGQLAVCGAERQ